jgi:hypothetical protein
VGGTYLSYSVLSQVHNIQVLTLLGGSTKRRGKYKEFSVSPRTLQGKGMEVLLPKGQVIPAAMLPCETVFIDYFIVVF